MKYLLLALLILPTAAYPVHSLGLKRNHLTFRRFLAESKKYKRDTRAPVPGKYDLTSKVSPPEDQGSCGSCWDFSITKALRSALMLAGTDPGTLAFNYLLNNCGGADSEGGCNGGDFPAGKNMLSGKGPWLESQDPYSASEGRCKNLPMKGTAIDWAVVGNGNTPPTFEELASAVSENHMLSVDVAVCGNWDSYSGGIFSKSQCGASSINHMINMVGYNCETSVDKSGNCDFNTSGQPVNGDGFLIVENNWGTSWGENGYMRTRYGVDAIADTAMYFDVVMPVPSPSPSPTPSPIPSPSPSPVPVPRWHGFLCPWLHFLPWCHFD